MKASWLSPESVSDLAVAAIHATTDPQGWTRLCDLVADATDAAAFFVFAFNLEDRNMPSVFGSHTAFSPAVMEMAERARQGDGSEDAVLYEELARSEPGKVLGERDLYRLPSSKPLPKNSWRDKMLAATGGHRRSLIKINDLGPFLDAAALHEGPAAKGLPLEKLAPVLHPILSRTMETTRVVAALSESYDRLMTLFDRLDFGAAFCAADRRILTANRYLRSVIGDRDGLNEAFGKLVADTASGTEGLQKLVTDAIRPDTPPGLLTLSLTRRSGRLPLVVHVAPIQGRNVGLGATVLVLVVDPEDGSRLNTKGIASFGLLTPAELEVCDLLVRGFETREIADQRGTQIQTTRDQIKLVAEKLNCHSRLEILRLAMATSTSLRG